MTKWLVLRQKNHLETAPPFPGPCEAHEARFLRIVFKMNNVYRIKKTPEIEQFLIR